jgi:hypothetical protein
MVVRGGEIFLRLVGGGGSYSLMTATAGEDKGSLRACANQHALRQAARRTASDFKVEPHEDKDSAGREFVRICGFTIDGPAEESRQQTLREVYEVCDTLFKNFDHECDEAGGEDSGLKAIYDVLAIDDSGDAVYLSDGVWLGSDGSLSDLGR